MSTAEVRFKRADRLYHWSWKAFFIFAAIMLTVIVYQVAHLQGDFTNAQTAELKRQEQSREDARKRLDKALVETQKQQVITQNYVRCVATLLLLPQEQRTSEKLDACGIPGVTDPDQLGQTHTEQSATVQSDESTTPPATAPSTQSTEAKPNQPVAAGSPPDNLKPSNQSFLDKLPVVGGFFDAIGL